MITLHSSFVSLLFALLSTSVGQLLFRMYYVRTKNIYLAAALGTFLAVPFFSYLALLNLTLAFVYMSTALVHVLVLIMAHMFLKPWPVSGVETAEEPVCPESVICGCETGSRPLFRAAPFSSFGNAFKEFAISLSYLFFCLFYLQKLFRIGGNDLVFGI